MTRAQLRRAGLSRSEVEGRIAKRLLLRVHRGVFRVGHGAPSIDATYLAAVLACGDGAVLSGRAAAHLLSLLKGRAPRPDVTTHGERKLRGVAVKRTRGGRETEKVRGIPLTTPAETLVDLAGVLSAEELARACHEAGVLHKTTPREVKRAIARRGRPAGAAKLRRIMEGDERVTLSHLERSFLSLLKRNGLPLPQTNRQAGGRRVDCRWPDHKLTVELDSYTFHNSRHAWEQSYQREREARGRGDVWKRFTQTDVDEERYAVSELAPILT